MINPRKVTLALTRTPPATALRQTVAGALRATADLLAPALPSASLIPSASSQVGEAHAQFDAVVARLSALEHLLAVPGPALYGAGHLQQTAIGPVSLERAPAGPLLTTAHRPELGSKGQALLIDLDNAITRGKSGYDRQFADIARLAGPTTFTLAIGRPEVVERLRAVMEERNIPFQKAGVQKDAADKALLAVADDLERQGYRHFAVASSDHAFAVLAKKGPLTVLASRPLSKELENVATKVRAVPPHGFVRTDSVAG